jgi:hypothetical protein
LVRHRRWTERSFLHNSPDGRNCSFLTGGRNLASAENQVPHAAGDPPMVRHRRWTERSFLHNSPGGRNCSFLTGGRNLASAENQVPHAAGDPPMVRHRRWTERSFLHWWAELSSPNTLPGGRNGAFLHSSAERSFCRKVKNPNRVANPSLTLQKREEMGKGREKGKRQKRKRVVQNIPFDSILGFRFQCMSRCPQVNRRGAAMKSSTFGFLQLRLFSKQPTGL